MPVHVSGVLVSSWSLLIRGILAALRQKLHLSACPNLASHLWVSRIPVQSGIGLGGVTAEGLLQASLRMRPDRILLGEMRDDAAWTYLNEVVSGHPGSISTIHGANPVQGFKKLFSLVKGSEQGAALEDRTLIEMLSAAIDVIVPFATTGEVYEIGEVWLKADARRRGETVADLLAQH